MQRALGLALILLLTIGAGAESMGSSLLQITGSAGSDGAGVVSARGSTLLTLRGPDAVARAQNVAGRLNSAALAGLRPGELTVRRDPSGFSIVAAGNVVVTVDQAAARHSGSEPEPLARRWRDNIASVFSEPYLAVEAPQSMNVPVGEQRGFRWGGTASAPPTVTTSAPSVLVGQVDERERRILLRALAPGQATVTVGAGSSQTSFPAFARLWAAQIAPTAEGRLSGHDLPGALVEQAALNAALAGARLQPGARLEVRRFWSSGGSWNALLEALSGPEYLTVRQEVAVAVRWVAPPRVPISLTMISNVPEKVTDMGMLMREALDAGQGARLLWHHVNRTSARMRFLAQIVNPGTEPAKVHLSWAKAGPGHDEIYLGHQALRMFWETWANGCGYSAWVPPMSAWNLYQDEFGPGHILSGLAHLQVIEGDGLLIETKAVSASAAVGFFEQVSPAAYERAMLSRFTFPSVRHIQVEHTARGAWTFHHIGKDPSLNHHGEALAGDYGVLQEIHVRVHNPTDTPATVELAVQASGGAARGIFRFGAETLETGLLRPNQEATIRRITVQPGQRTTLDIQTMPQSGSNYPLTLVVRTLR